MPVSKLKVIFDSPDAEMKKFDNLLKDQTKHADQLEKEVKKVGDTSENSFKKASNGMNGLVTAVKAFLALELVRRVADFTIEASKAAAAAEGITAAFRNLGGTTADIKAMSDAVGGTVNNVKLMTIQVEALQKGLDKLTLVKVLAFADKQADATGKSLEEVANTIIFSLGKNAVKGLDAVGLSTKEINKDVKTMGVQNAILKQMEIQTKKLGDVAAPTADAYDRLAVAQENLEIAFGNLVNSDGFRKMQNFLAETLTGIGNFLNDPFAIKGLDTAGLDTELTSVIDQINAEGEKFFFNQDQALLANLRNKRDAIMSEQEFRVQSEAAAAQKIITDEAAKKQAAIDAQTDYREKSEAAVHQLMIDNFFDVAQIASAEFAKIPDLMIAKLNEEALLLQQFADHELKQQVTGAIDIDEENLKNFGRKGTPAGDMPEIVDASKKVEDNFAAAATSVFSLVDALAGLGDSNKSNGKKFLKVIQALLAIGGTLVPGLAPILGAASVGFGTLAGLARNKGGIIPGGGPDQDSVLAKLTPGEFVTKRTSTQRSPLLLDAINSGELDDTIFKRMVNTTVVNVDQKQVVDAIKSIPQTDLFKSGSALYEVRRQAHEKGAQRRRRLIPSIS